MLNFLHKLINILALAILWIWFLLCGPRKIELKRVDKYKDL